MYKRYNTILSDYIGLHIDYVYRVYEGKKEKNKQNKD